jgi:hypothetical protein
MNITNFLGSVSERGIQRPNLFTVAGDIGDTALGETDSFFIRAASLPSMEIGEIVLPYKGRQLKVPGDRTFGDWDITIISDENMDLYDAFQSWHEKMGASTVSNLGDSTSAGRAFVGDAGYKNWKVATLDRNGEQTNQYEIVGCWPKSVGAIEVGADTNDALAEFTVTLTYQYFTNTTDTAKRAIPSS